jgi:hypothetical protein
VAPSSTLEDITTTIHENSHEKSYKPTIVEKPTAAGSPLVQSLKYGGSLDEENYKSFDVTNVIGREYPEASLLDILRYDKKIRDLAIIISQRGVVFFRNKEISVEDQKTLGQKLGELTDKPASSKVRP